VDFGRRGIRSKIAASIGHAERLQCTAARTAVEPRVISGLVAKKSRACARPI
jgi:hypothetical protein